MVRNERMISLYTDSDYARFLSNRDELKSWIQEKCDSMVDGSYINMQNQVRLDALDNYILQLMENNQIGKLNRKDLHNYLDLVYENSNNVYFFRNCLLLSYPYVEQIYSKEKLERISKRSAFIRQTAKEIYDRLMSNQRVSEDDMNKLLVFLTGAIGKTFPELNNVLDNVFCYLLTKDSRGEQLSYKENYFMIQMMSFYSTKELNIPYTNLYISNTNFSGAQLKDFQDGGSYGNNGIIYINKVGVAKRKVGNKDLTSLQYYLMCVAHENRHSYQVYNIGVKDPNLAIFETIKSDLFRRELSKSGFDEYHQNYRFNGMEDDANRFGYFFLRNILHKRNIRNTVFDKGIDSSLFHLQYKQSLAYKRDDKQTSAVEFFDVKNLISIVKKHPDYLRQYPMLQVVFNMDGSVKNMSELFDSLIRKDGGFDSKRFDVARDFVLRELDMHVENVDIEQMDNVSQIKFFMFMFEILYLELKKLKNSIVILGDDINVFDRITKIRIERLNKYINLLNKYESLILHLASVDRFGEPGRALWIAKRNINESVYGIRKYVMKSDKLDNSTVYDDLVVLSESEVLASGPRI